MSELRDHPADDRTQRIEVRVRRDATLYKDGRWYRGGEIVLVNQRHAMSLIRRGTVQHV